MEPVISDMAADTTKPQQGNAAGGKKGGDAVGEDDKGKTESVSEQ